MFFFVISVKPRDQGLRRVPSVVLFGFFLGDPTVVWPRLEFSRGNEVNRDSVELFNPTVLREAAQWRWWLFYFDVLGSWCYDDIARVVVLVRHRVQSEVACSERQGSCLVKCTLIHHFTRKSC